MPSIGGRSRGWISERGGLPPAFGRRGSPYCFTTSDAAMFQPRNRTVAIPRAAG
jgi:hypothetical protein